jgi:two-component system nitrate/nitrite response regulator NarL
MKIVICDGHQVFADALASLLHGAGHEVAGSVIGLQEAAEICGRAQADVCVVDLRPMRTGGRPDIEQAVRSAPGTAFVALSASADAATLRQAAAAGARGVVLKGDDFGEFVHVVMETVSSQERGAGPRPAKEVVLSKSARAALRAGQGVTAGPSQFLTEREWEALGRLVRGEGTAAMARAMGVRISTARTHIDAVLSKLGAHSRLEAVAYAVKEGLVDTGNWQREQRAVGI